VTAEHPRHRMPSLNVALLAGVAHKLRVLIRVHTVDAPARTKKVRKPYHLALVIGRCGSRSGPPLLEAVRCARHIADQLEPADTA